MLLTESLLCKISVNLDFIRLLTDNTSDLAVDRDNVTVD